jgi:Flp pilus assembly secretin CpaC/tetratricopeptide (TPR) repeat protein
MREPLMHRSTLIRSVPFVAGMLFLAAGCSSSNGDAVETAPPTAADAPTAADPAAQGGQDVADRARQIDSKRRAASAELVGQGRALAAQGRFEEARKTFLDAYMLDVNNTEAARELDNMNVVLGRETVGATPDARQGFESMVGRHQQAQVQAKYYFNLGVKARGEGNHALAVENFQKTLTILKVNPSIDAEFSEKSVRAALDAAKADGEAAARAADADRARTVAEIERKREDDERARVRRQVEENYRQAVELFKREKFSECQRLCQEVLNLDYAHVDAKGLMEAARRAEIDLARGENIAMHREQWLRWIEETTEIRVPQTEIVKFPSLDKWKEITAAGPIDLNPAAAKPSEADEEVIRRLEGTMLRSIDWSGKPLKDALSFLRNTTNVNVYVEKAVDEKVPEADRVLALTFENISAASALKLAVESLKLKYLVEGGVVKITTPEELGKRKITNFYEVRDLTGKIPNFISQDLNLSVSGGAAAAPEEDTEENRQIEAERLIEMIRSAVDKPSWDDGSGNTIIDKNGTLVVRQTADNHRAIRKLLGEIRKTTGLQVAIESRFISVENNFLQDIGVDFRGLGDNSGGTGVPGRGTNAPFDDFGVPGTGQLPIGSDNSAGLFYSRGADGDIRGRAENVFNNALGSPDTLTNSGGFALQYAFIEDTQVEAILRATQKYERVNTVTAPKLVVSNTQRAHLQVINHVSYIKDFDVEIAQGAVIADPIVDVVKEGVVLDVRPTVSNDRRFITLELRPSVATLVRPLRTFTTTLGVGSAVTFEVPELKKESIKTTVIMPDGATLLLGGMKFYDEQDYVSGIPILKDIPILDLLFSRKGKYTALKDLIVLLKVQILVAQELEPGSTSAAR